MFGRLFSLIGLSWGNGGMSVDGAPSEPPSFPPLGTILSTSYVVEFPPANGGGTVDINSTLYPNQNCDVNLIADGVGGSYYDWANAFNVIYKPLGSSITGEMGTYYVTINGYNYSSGTYSNSYYHDGSGSFYADGTSSYNTYGEFITSDNIAGNNYISTPMGSFAYEGWDGNNYYHDGSGGYYSNYINFAQVPDNAYIGNDGTAGSSSTEVPSGSGNYYAYTSWSSKDYYFQLSGYTYQEFVNTNFTANYGDYITSDGTYTYYWDGTGGYYYF